MTAPKIWPPYWPVGYEQSAEQICCTIDLLAIVFTHKMGDIVKMGMGYVPVIRGADGLAGATGLVIGTPTAGIDVMDGGVGNPGVIGGTIGSVSDGVTPVDGMYYNNSYVLISAPPATGLPGANAAVAINGLDGNGKAIGNNVSKWRYVQGGTFTIGGVVVGTSSVAKPGEVVAGIGMSIRQLN